jgi:hypothetical protein
MNQMQDSEIVIHTGEFILEHPEVWHYTQRDSFESIFKTQTLRSTYFGDLNDRQEVVTLQEHLIKCIDKLLDNINGGSMLAQQFVSSLYNATFCQSDPPHAIHADPSSLTRLDAYTTSFTTHAVDCPFVQKNGLESQWSEYAPNGFCFVFDTRQMCKLLATEFDTNDYTYLTFAPVRYAVAGVPLGAYFDFIESAIEKVVSQIKLAIQLPNPPAVEMPTVEFLRAATLLKRDCFQEEREVRIVAIPATEARQQQAALEYSNSNPSKKALPIIDTKPKRHITLFRRPGVKLPIKRVIVGPSDRQSENLKLARRLVGNVPIHASECEQLKPGLK